MKLAVAGEEKARGFCSGNAAAGEKVLINILVLTFFAPRVLRSDRGHSRHMIA
jgi:hypothetical protein